MQTSSRDDIAEFFRLFMEEGDDGIWMAVFDPPLLLGWAEERQLKHFFQSAIIKRCNATFARMYGYNSASKLIGIPILNFIARDDPQNVSVLKAFLQPPHSVREAETHERDKQGNTRWFLNDAWGIAEGDSLVRAWGRQREITVGKQREIERSGLSSTLSPRLKALLHLIGEGHTAKEIADVFSVTEKTVHNHRERLMKQLGVSDVTALIHYAHRLGIAHNVNASNRLSSEMHF